MRDHSSDATAGVPRFYLDVTDPLSYARELELREADPALSLRMERVPLALRAAGAPLVDTSDEAWLRRLRSARRALAGIGRSGLPAPSDPPRLVPDPGKAHELLLLAAEEGEAPEMANALFRAFLHDGKDIGRIDLLVHLAREIGLEGGAIKVALDLDVHTDRLAKIRDRASELHIRPPFVTPT